MIRNEASSSTNNNNNGRGQSVVDDVGRQRSSCGYCKSGSNSSITHGLWAHSLTVDDYQALLDRGWRRSGCVLYKPEMEKTCCPSYTIRLKANDFVPSKEQIRVAKRMQSCMFIDGTLNAKIPGECTSSVQGNVLIENGVQKNDLEQVTRCLSDQIDSVVHACIKQGEFPLDIQFPKASVKSVAPAKRKLLAEGSQDLLYSSNIPFQISSALTRASKKPRFSKSTDNCTEKGNQCGDPNPKHIADEMSTRLSTLVPALGLSVKAFNGHINFYSTEIQAHQPDVTVGKPAIAKASSRDNSGKKSSLGFAGKIQAKGPNLEIRLKRSSFDPAEYALYKRYQIRVHDDEPDQVTESSYMSFLVDSPLVYVPSSRNSTAPPCGFGSFHQQYLIDGKLVAVGVIDILPRCLSSKYFFWDPDLAFLSLGKYSTLQEINWVRENQGRCPSLQYYYLGYYIHSCNKMRYKAAYRPSELLCPLRYQWVPFDIAKRLLDRKPYVVLSDFATLQNESSSPNVFEDHMEPQNEPCIEELNDKAIDDDEEEEEEETSELNFEDSNDESGPETTSLALAEMRKEDVNNVLVGLNERRMRYKDIREAFGLKDKNYLESQLHRYLRVVGTDLSERMVYSLG